MRIRGCAPAWDEAEPSVSLATNCTGKSGARERSGLCSRHFSPAPASAAVPTPEAAPPICPDAWPCPSADRARTDDRFEIELGSGRLVRVGSGIDTGALKRILNSQPGLVATGMRITFAIVAILIAAALAIVVGATAAASAAQRNGLGNIVGRSHVYRRWLWRRPRRSRPQPHLRPLVGPLYNGAPLPRGANHFVVAATIIASTPWAGSSSKTAT
jgi:hypothetical protein